jgi:phthalate 4,5-dioxygenase oxygenase subunit
MDLQRNAMYVGIYSVGNLQDRAMTELMTSAGGTEPIYDRTREHLGQSDLMIIAVRHKLIDACEALRDKGIVPPNVDNVALDRIRSAQVRLPAGADWVALTEKYLDFDSGSPTGADDIPFLRPSEPEPANSPA